MDSSPPKPRPLQREVRGGEGEKSKAADEFAQTRDGVSE
jgi:hypothetical protein